jgi:hypothetical protein
MSLTGRMISRTGGGRIEIPQLYVPPKIALLNTRIPLLKEQLKMPPKARGKAKMPKNPSHTSSKKSGFMEPPLPFSRVPTHLEPLLAQLSTKHVYIIHIDTLSKDFKKNIFLVPTLMNIATILLIVWRIKAIAPFYFDIFQSMFGIVNHTTMDTDLMTWPEIIKEISTRALNFLFDFTLYVFIWPWPQAFFIGAIDIGTPVDWRWKVGFRDQEIIVRRSRRWDENLGDVVLEQDSVSGRQFSATVRLAVAGSYMNGRTGYSMLNREWDLDWWTMAECTKLVDKNEMSLDDFKTRILVHSDEFGWVFEAQDTSGNSQEDEARSKIVAFKDELTKLGKENLFFKWIELIQFESSRPEGFGPERQVEAMRKAKQMFEAQGVDFEAFWAKVGGMEGLPGMDQFGT